MVIHCICANFLIVPNSTEAIYKQETPIEQPVAFCSEHLCSKLLISIKLNKSVDLITLQQIVNPDQHCIDPRLSIFELKTSLKKK